MTYDDFTKRLNDAISNPDTVQASALALLGDVKADFVERDTMKDAVAVAEKRIRDLQDTNQKLFLMQTGRPAAGDGNELDGMDAVDAFVNEVVSK